DCFLPEAQFHRIIPFHIRHEAHTLRSCWRERVKRLLAQIATATLIGIVPTASSGQPVTLSQDHHANPSGEENKSVHQPTSEQRAAGIYQPWSDADIEFMTG